MNFENLTNESKIEVIQQTIVQLETEIYRSCIMLNIDPDTLDPETYTYDTPVVRHEYVQLKHSIDSLNAAKSHLVTLMG